MPRPGWDGRRLLSQARMATWETRIANAACRLLAARRKRVLAAVRSQFGAVTADAVMPIDPFGDDTWGQDVETDLQPIIEGVFAEIGQDFAQMVGAADLPPIDFGAATDLLLSRFAAVGLDVSAALTDALSQGVNFGESIPELADRVKEVFAASDYRATMIARTETAAAATRTGLDWASAVNDAGLTLAKVWLDSAGSCDECQDLASDDPIGVDDSFSSGDDGPPLHPNCTCSLAFEVVDDQSGDAVDVSEEDLAAVDEEG